jgi:prepilin-type N-terminal cleavage/methylation domain-containing protein
MRTRVRLRVPVSSIGAPLLRDERGFTLIEVMIAIVLMTVGLLAAADSFPKLAAEGLYGKDESRGANLAQQQIEIYRNTTTSTLASLRGDYGTVASSYFDQNGNTVSSTAAYFTRDVQIQYWAWVTSTNPNAFAKPSSPYVTPTGSYIYHVAVTTHWPVKGQTIFTTGTTSGCVLSGTVVTVGRGCITVATFVAGP